MKVVFWWKKGRNVYVNPISRSGGDCNGNLEMPGPSDTGSLECIWGVLYNKLTYLWRPQAGQIQ